VAGSVVDKLTPEVVIAKLINGTASSIRSSNFLISEIMNFSSSSFCARDFAFELPRRASSSSPTAFASRTPRD